MNLALAPTFGAFLSAAAAVLALAAVAPAAAQSACPAGYRYRSALSDCLSVRQPSCPPGYRISPDRSQCHGADAQAGVASCPTAYTFHRLSRHSGECRSIVAPSCPDGTRLDSRTGRCARGAIPR